DLVGGDLADGLRVLPASAPGVDGAVDLERLGDAAAAGQRSSGGWGPPMNRPRRQADVANGGFEFARARVRDAAGKFFHHAGTNLVELGKWPLFCGGPGEESHDRLS